MPVFARTETGAAKVPLGPTTASDKTRPKLRAETEVSLAAEGPFAPLGSEILRNDRLRAELALALEIPASKAIAKARLVTPIFVALLVWVTFMDATATASMGAEARLSERISWAVVDLLGAVAVAFDGSRRAIHRRWVVAAIVAGAAARVWNHGAETCTLYWKSGASGAPSVVPYVGAGLALVAVVAMVFWLSRVPPTRVVARAILDALDIRVDDVLALPEPPLPTITSAYVVGAFTLVFAGSALLLKQSSLTLSAVVALAVSIGAGLALHRLDASASANANANAPPPSKLAPNALPAADSSADASLNEALKSPVLSLPIFAAGLVGFLGAAFATRAAFQGFDTGAHLLRCRDAVSFESSGAKRQLLLEGVEALSARARARDTWPNTLAVTLAFPIAYEWLFRKQLQRVLTQRYGGMTGLFTGALAYALSASLTYESLFYQTVAAGLAFGLIYSEAGIAAAILAHVLYAAHLVL